MKHTTDNRIARESADKRSGSLEIIETKKKLSSARDLRDGLASMAIALSDQVDKQGYLVVIETKLSRSFQQDQLNRFKSALRPDIVNRLHIIFAENGKIDTDTTNMCPITRERLRQIIDDHKKPRTELNPPNKKNEVLLLLMHQWIKGKGTISSKTLEEKVGCNYRTVAAAIEEVAHAVYRHTDRSVSLKYFPQQDWGRLLAVANRTRATMLYVDASDQPRAFDSLLQRLWRLNLKHIAVGGVLGARRYDPDLDIVGTPRLDLCVHAPEKTVDLEFMRALDPALERTQDIHRPARVALHFIRRKDALFCHVSDGTIWADPVECLLNLYNAKLEQQARSFQEFLMAQAKELNG